MAAQTNVSPQTPWLFASGPYMSLREWFDSEDVIAGISLPMIQMLTGRSPRFRDFLMGFLNQIIARNAVALTGGGMNPVGQVAASWSSSATGRLPVAQEIGPIRGLLPKYVQGHCGKSDCRCRWFYHRRHPARLPLKKTRYRYKCLIKRKSCASPKCWQACPTRSESSSSLPC